MNGPIAQAVALVCHGNAVLRGLQPATFWPTNSTAQFCDRISFVRLARKWLGGWRTEGVASTADEWFVELRRSNKRSLFLSHSPSGDSRLSDRLSSAFVGGGGSWLIEVVGPGMKTHLWAGRWTVWNKKAPQQRIWRVEYGMLGEGKSSQPKTRLEEIERELTGSLEEIRNFALELKLDPFTDCFVRALEALQSEGGKRSGYHKDLAPEGVLSTRAASCLDACQSAWVFGGMGSWNDLGFEGATQGRYQQASDRLYNELNAAIVAAANDSAVASESQGRP